MRKLKLILHTNQLEDLSTSRHATWFRHIIFCKNVVFNFSYWSDGKCQEKLKTMLMQNVEPISIPAEKVNRKGNKKKKMQASSSGAVNFTFTATCGRKLCTAIPRKVVGKNVHAATQKVSMGYDQYTVPHTVVIEPAVFPSRNSCTLRLLTWRARMSTKTSHQTLQYCPKMLLFGELIMPNKE